MPPEPMTPAQRDRIAEMVREYSAAAAGDKSVRRRDAYAEAVDELQRVLDGKQGLAYVHSLYHDKSLFEHNPTKLAVVQRVKHDIGVARGPR